MPRSVRAGVLRSVRPRLFHRLPAGSPGDRAAGHRRCEPADRRGQFGWPLPLIATWRRLSSTWHRASSTWTRRHPSPPFPRASRAPRLAADPRPLLRRHPRHAARTGPHFM